MGPVATWLVVVAGAAVVAITWALVWSVPAVALRRNDLADAVWGPLFPTMLLLVGGAVVVFDPGSAPRALLVVALASAWAIRLSWHIGRRWSARDEEDRRYAAWRERWGRRWIVGSVVFVWVGQALVALVAAQPMLVAVAVPDADASLGVLDAIGVLLVVVGITLEAVADGQLRRFLARPDRAERYLTSGVWAWSRHPNYAGDAIAWIGFGLVGVAAALDANAPLLVVPALTGPAVMWWFLRHGSGVPITERGRAGQPEWDAYVERTSPFWPRPPRGAGDAAQ